MTKRMLIDATHAEETRVVVVDGNRLEDFDVETSTKRHLKGNIYLAKVIRVEPSLQAAFVEYGGGRHGFLAFGEIHPDYYQIPVADRQRLLQLQAEEARAEAEAEDSAAHAAADPEAISEAPHAAVQTTVEPVEPEYGEADNGHRLGDDTTAELPPAGLDGPPAEPDGPKPSDHAAEHIEAAEPAAGQLAGDDEASANAPVDTQPEHKTVDTPPEHQTLDAQAAEGSDPANRARPALIPQDMKFGELAFGEASHAGAATALHEATTETETETEIAPLPWSGDEHRPQEEYETRTFEAPITESPPPETIGGDGDAFESDGADEARARRASRFLRNYRIQEVIRRRQILLVQVVKEERGTKGAALTTYISLAGRFCVLMPNSPRGGGISRKITSPADRRRLKEITAELDVPVGMGLIVRTAGANRPKPEIKRDCEYLMRLWDDIREHTLKSVAPALIYEEASLIKRAIRDVYSRDVDEILVDGEEAWRAAHDFMRMLMPSHAKKVQLWRSAGPNGRGQPLFSKMGVEAQLDAMLSPIVQLKSGGYLVVNQTEALVAIDVNSGRSTRERGIEETALRTNMEAADEAARQLRLRDLAGLIVIDFIDMEAKKHNSMVERRLKEALKIDRARIQVGHISHFGLMEMSRQRLRPSLAETSFVACPHCGGLGHVRSVESSAIHVLRAIEEEGIKARASLILVHVASPIAMYILNQKRERLREIELSYGLQVHFSADDALVPPAVRIEQLRAQLPQSERPAAVPVAIAPPIEPHAAMDDAEEEADVVPAEAGGAQPDAAADEGDGQAVAAGTTTAEDTEPRRRRRRRRRGARRDGQTATAAGEEGGDDGDEADEDGAGEDGPDNAPGEDVSAVAATPRKVVAPAEGTATDEAAGPVADLGAAEQPSVDPADLDEDGLARARRRGRRGGRRRRRDGSVEAVEGEVTPAEEEPQDRGYGGPTPADPYGGLGYDSLDRMEPDEAPGRAEAMAQVRDDLPAIDIPPVPRDARALASGAPRSEPGQEKAEPGGEPEPSQAVAEAAEPETPAAPAIRPIVIGQDALPDAERKRGWWRR